MRFKTSSINKELLIYIFRSSGWISLLYLIGLLFSLPLEVLMAVLDERDHYYAPESNLLFIHGSIQNALILVIPVLLAVFLFRFLQVKQISDLIHSLPISRKQIYVHHVLTGVGFLLLPILITVITLLVFMWTFDVSQLYTLEDIGIWFGVTFTIELIIFSAAVFMGMITGLSALQAVLTYIFLLLPVGLLVLFVSNLKFLLFGFSESYYLSLNIKNLSPITAIIDVNTVKLFTVEMYIYLLLTVCLLFGAFLLYKRRKHEFVSHAFVFPVIKPVFKYGMITGLMLLSGLYFSETTENLEWLLFGYIIGAILGFLLAEMVLQKTWRIRLQLKGFVYFSLIAMALVMLIKFDLIGFESRVPDTSEIKKVYISNLVSSYYDSSNPETYTLLTDTRNIQTLRRLHQQIIEHGEDERFESNSETPSVFLTYELQNGRKVSREYQLRNYEAFSPYFRKIYETKEYKQGFYSVLNISPKDVYRIHITGSGHIEKSVQLSNPKEIKQALKALHADLSSQTYEEMKKTSGEYGYISFTLGGNRDISFPWKASYKHFNQWMEETGKVNQARIIDDDISYMLIQKYDSRIDYYSQNFVQQKNALKIQKAEQKDELLDMVTSGVGEAYVVALFDESGNYLDIRGLSNENVPDYIQNHFNK